MRTLFKYIETLFSESLGRFGRRKEANSHRQKATEDRLLVLRATCNAVRFDTVKEAFLEKGGKKQELWETAEISAKVLRSMVSQCKMGHKVNGMGEMHVNHPRGKE
jgi:hypothetical protein